MRIKSSFSTLAVLALVPSASWGGLITYDIRLNTAPLVGHTAGPFSIEFQLNDGSGTNDGNNTAVLSNFTFAGGSVVGAPTLTGGATGAATTSVSLTDSSFFNQFIQKFTAGSQLGFRLALSTNLDASGVPDQFTFAVLDSSGTELPTRSFFDVFIQIDINLPNPLVQTFGTDTGRLPAAGGPAIDIAAPSAVPVASTVPEPTTWTLLASGLGVIGLTTNRRKLEGLILRASARVFRH